MPKHDGTPFRRDKCVAPAVISPPGAVRGRFVGGHQSGLAGCKPPPLFKRGASSCSSQRHRQGDSWGASPQPSAPTYLPPFEKDFSRYCAQGCTMVPEIVSYAGPRLIVDCKDPYLLEWVLQLNNTPHANGHTIKVEQRRHHLKPEDIYALAYK